MGCDIHVFIEYKRGSSHDWELDRGHKETIDNYGTVDERFNLSSVDASGRDYEFFGLLAGVRGDGAIFTPRGIPKNLSPKIKKEIDMWGVDAHSHTYLSLSEYKQVLKKAKHDISKEGKKAMAFHTGNNWNSVYFPSWVDIYHHCFNIMEKSKVDAILLGNDDLAFKKCRLVFFFDS